MKKFLTIFLVFIIISAKSQQKAPQNPVGIVIGNVLETGTSKAVEGATVTIVSLKDTSYRRSQVTDKNGSFEFERLPFAYFSLSVSGIGFNALKIDSIHLREERFDFNLGDLKLNRSSATLSEVIVYAEKPLIENADGKITYNVGESALSNGSTTAELLKTMPLINNDPDGKILLKGKEPKILIDDKPTELNAQQLQDLLESMPGSSIEKIELMTNPPPQYASEAGGVINIITRKGKIGLFGKINLSYGTRGEASAAANVSYRNKKFTISSNVGAGFSRYAGSNYSYRTNFYTDSSNYFNTEGNFLNKNLRPNFRVQSDYEINTHNTISATLQSNISYLDNYSFNQYTNLNRNNEIYKLSTRENASDGNGHNNIVTLSYIFRGKNLAERLQIIADANVGKNDNGRDFFQAFLNPDFSPTGVDSTQVQGIDNYSKTRSLRADYNKPLWKDFTLTTGASYYRTNNHNILNTEFLRKQDNTLVLNDILSSNFRFQQDIYAGRAAFTYRFGKDWRITAGMATEGTTNTFNFIQGNAADVKSAYFNILPNLTFRKDFSRTVNSSLVYRKTIRRPGIVELNPAIDYSNPYNIRFGNPYLSPSVADNFDWNASVGKGKYYINASVGYNRVKDIYNTIRTLIESGKTQTTYVNISGRKEYESSIWGGYTFSRKVRMNASLGYTYSEYSEQDIALFNYRNGSTFYTSLNYSYNPTTLTTLDGNARFSSFADPQGHAKSNLAMNLGIQRKFFNKRLILSFNVIDPITAQKYVTYIYGAKFSSENYNSTRTRNFRIGISYQLNKVVQKSSLSEKQKNALLKKVQGK